MYLPPDYDDSGRKTNWVGFVKQREIALDQAVGALNGRDCASRVRRNFGNREPGFRVQRQVQKIGAIEVIQQGRFYGGGQVKVLDGGNRDNEVATLKLTVFRN
jgi:hypothetical protein